jgi:hypothetical protein
MSTPVERFHEDMEEADRLFPNDPWKAMLYFIRKRNMHPLDLDHIEDPLPYPQNIHWPVTYVYDETHCDFNCEDATDLI